MEEPGTVQLTVQRSGRLNVPVSVAYRTLDGSAETLQGDYQEIFRSILDFAVGEYNKTFSVTVLDDTVPEGNETFMVELFDAIGNIQILLILSHICHYFCYDCLMQLVIYRSS